MAQSFPSASASGSIQVELITISQSGRKSTLIPGKIGVITSGKTNPDFAKLLDRADAIKRTYKTGDQTQANESLPSPTLYWVQEPGGYQSPEEAIASLYQCDSSEYITNLLHRDKSGRRIVITETMIYSDGEFIEFPQPVKAYALFGCAVNLMSTVGVDINVYVDGATINPTDAFRYLPNGSLKNNGTPFLEETIRRCKLKLLSVDAAGLEVLTMPLTGGGVYLAALTDAEKDRARGLIHQAWAMAYQELQQAGKLEHLQELVYCLPGDRDFQAAISTIQENYHEAKNFAICRMDLLEAARYFAAQGKKVGADVSSSDSSIGGNGFKLRGVFEATGAMPSEERCMIATDAGRRACATYNGGRYERVAINTVDIQPNVRAPASVSVSAPQAASIIPANTAASQPAPVAIQTPPLFDPELAQWDSHYTQIVQTLTQLFPKLANEPEKSLYQNMTVTFSQIQSIRNTMPTNIQAKQHLHAWLMFIYSNISQLTQMIQAREQAAAQAVLAWRPILPPTNPIVLAEHVSAGNYWGNQQPATSAAVVAVAAPDSTTTMPAPAAIDHIAEPAASMAAEPRGSASAPPADEVRERALQDFSKNLERLEKERQTNSVSHPTRYRRQNLLQRQQRLHEQLSSWLRNQAELANTALEIDQFDTALEFEQRCLALLDQVKNLSPKNNISLKEISQLEENTHRLEQEINELEAQRHTFMTTSHIPSTDHEKTLILQKLPVPSQIKDTKAETTQPDILLSSRYPSIIERPQTAAVAAAPASLPIQSAPTEQLPPVVSAAPVATGPIFEVITDSSTPEPVSMPLPQTPVDLPVQANVAEQTPTTVVTSVSEASQVDIPALKTDLLATLGEVELPFTEFGNSHIETLCGTEFGESYERYLSQLDTLRQQGHSTNDASTLRALNNQAQQLRDQIRTFLRNAESQLTQNPSSTSVNTAASASTSTALVEPDRTAEIQELIHQIEGCLITLWNSHEYYHSSESYTQIHSAYREAKEAFEAGRSLANEATRVIFSKIKDLCSLESIRKIEGKALFRFIEANITALPSELTTSLHKLTYREDRLLINSFEELVEKIQEIKQEIEKECQYQKVKTSRFAALFSACQEENRALPQLIDKLTQAQRSFSDNPAQTEAIINLSSQIDGRLETIKWAYTSLLTAADDPDDTRRNQVKAHLEAYNPTYAELETQTNTLCDEAVRYQSEAPLRAHRAREEALERAQKTLAEADEQKRRRHAEALEALQVKLTRKYIELEEMRNTLLAAGRFLETSKHMTLVNAHIQRIDQAKGKIGALGRSTDENLQEIRRLSQAENVFSAEYALLSQKVIENHHLAAKYQGNEANRLTLLTEIFTMGNRFAAIVPTIAKLHEAQKKKPVEKAVKSEKGLTKISGNPELTRQQSQKASETDAAIEEASLALSSANLNEATRRNMMNDISSITGDMRILIGVCANPINTQQKERVEHQLAEMNARCGNMIAFINAQRAALAGISDMNISYKSYTPYNPHAALPVASSAGSSSGVQVVGIYGENRPNTIVSDPAASPNTGLN